MHLPRLPFARKPVRVNRRHAPHLGAPVPVGRYTILAGGLQFLRGLPVWPGDILVPLTDAPLPEQSLAVRSEYPLHLPDFGGVPFDWEDRLADITEYLQAGRSVLAFCMASHGRTGTFLASLIALLEDEKATPDPIAAVRERHCEHAVESVLQGEAIFALRGRELPDKYRKTLWTPPPIKVAAQEE